ncbi:LysR family transcriptional regulator [Pseudodesulfovibrio cashew]|uniref:LysR family transcriptional regulator n=1 Tax=Pseudodesulfovibrio cashew TaxID=2678688 RepID=A0A6I6JGD8_9BACT|nr:LysR family transcriptional regulator [Pseudodesulfovibrio cashew]
MRYFVAVAERLNFRRAAEALHMTQPPLSQQIAALEEELETVLLVRDRRTVRLTPAGECLLEEARRILANLEIARQRVKDVGAGRTGRLRIGFVGPAIDGPLSADIRNFRRKHENVALELHELPTAAQLDSLRSGDLDLGMVRLVGHDASDLRCEVYHRERYVLAVPGDHPLAGRQSVTPADLDGEPMILFARRQNPILYDAWAASLADSGARLFVAQEAATKHTAVALAAAGHGIAPVPESTADTGRRGVRFIRFDGNIPPLELHAVYPPKSISPVRDAFLRSLDTDSGREKSA